MTPPAGPPSEHTTQRIPVDPWRGAAAVPAGPEPTMAEPQVIYVERPRRRRWPWVLAVLAVCAPVGGAVGYGIAAPIAQQHPASVAMPPDGVAGLTVATGEEVDRATAELKLEIHETVDVDDAFAYVLVDPGSPPEQVYFFGATLLILDPEAFITEAMRDLASEIQSFDPGPLGGHLRCGTHVGDDGAPALACAWADHGSVGVGVFLGGRPAAESAELLRDIRAEVLIRT
jgi:hypothetical protein